jgi:hypothetical protein
MHRLPLTALALLLAACSGGGGSQPTDSGTPGTTEPVAACELLAEYPGCPECADGTVTCSYGDVSATEMSCGGCQAEYALLAALCDAEEPASREELEAGISCGPPSCEVWYDGCSDPCTPQCVTSDSVPDTTCDLGCSTPGAPPAECAWDAASDRCAFAE